MDETIKTIETTEATGYEVIEIRHDGTYVIMLDGNPYHVTPEYCPELWASVKAQVEAVEV